MNRFLSIDWDYFVDASAEERNEHFPDSGDENLPPSVKRLLWNGRYDLNPKIKDIGIKTEDYATMKDIIENFYGNTPSINFLDFKHNIVESHKHIYKYIMERTQPDEEFEVYNVDFHHDMYVTGISGEDASCGNWGTVLKQQRPNCKMIWLGQIDSEHTTIFGDEVDAERILDIKRLQEIVFDYMFLCRSDLWSPPHLDHYFNDLVSSIGIINALEPRI